MSALGLAVVAEPVDAVLDTCGDCNGHGEQQTPPDPHGLAPTFAWTATVCDTCAGTGQAVTR